MDTETTFRHHPPTYTNPMLPTIQGKATLAVADRHGRVVDERSWESNTVLPYVPAMLWSLLNPFAAGLSARFTDGTLNYPSWQDIFNYITNPTNANWIVGGAARAAGPYVGGNGPSGGDGSCYFAWIGSALMGTLAIGNYTGAAPAGKASWIDGSLWSTYAIGQNYFGAGPGRPMGSEATSLYGPAITSASVSGQGFPSPQTTVTRTYASQAGTVNAIAFLPVSPTTAPLTTNTTEGPASVANPGTYLVPAVTTGLPTMKSIVTTGPGSFGTDKVVASTLYLASAPVTVPAGGQLTVSYTIASS